MPRPPAGLIRGSLNTVAIRLLDLPSRYGFHLLIAAYLGVTQAGRFYIVFSTMTALAGFGRLGIDRAMTRQIAIALAEQQTGAVRRIIWRGSGLILLCSIAMSLLLAACAGPLADHLLGKPDLATPLALGALTIIPQNLSTATAGALAGLHRVGCSQMVYSWLWPALFCLVTLLLGTDVPDALLLIAASFAAAALIGAALLALFVRRLPHEGDMAATVARYPLLRPGLSLFTLELTQLMIASAPAIILGMTASSDQVGLFALAWRIALLSNVLISGIANMATPKFAQLHGLGDRQGLTRAAMQSVGLGLGLVIGPVLVMMALPASLLGLFGEGFRQGTGVLRILALGQLAAACCTAMPELLGMTAQMVSLRRINALSLLTLLIGCALLTPHWAAIGAAIAASMAILVNGAGASWAVSRHLGIAPLRALLTSLRRRGVA